MKRILIAALAFSLAGACSAEARPGDRHRDDDRGRDRGRSERSERSERSYERRDRNGYGPRPAPQREWRPGQRVSPDRGEVVDYRNHRLRRPPRGYDWVRSGDGYLLRDSSSGMVTEVIPGR